MQFEKDKIIEQLLSNEMVITFNKVNGDERVMTCTLKPELLPAQKVTENKKEPSAKQLENIGVYDLNANAWRSFKVANVTNVQVADDAYEELNEIIKRPIRYFQVELGGYGGESVYAKVSKEAYDFWSQKDLDFNLEDYLFNAEEFIEENDIPEAANFLYSKEDDFYQEWYELEDELEHSYGVEYNNCWITVEETDTEEYNSETLQDVMSGIDLSTLTEEHDIDVDSEQFDLDKFADDDGNNYVLYAMSMEKGTFFSTTIESTTGDFNPKKLKFDTMEMPNGDEIVTSVMYNDEELDGLGNGDTRGKGYSADIWNY